MTTPMHPELASFFEQHRTQSAQRKRDVHDQLRPIAKVYADLRRYVVEMQAALHDAELAAHDGRLDPKFNYMHTRLAALERETSAFFAGARNLAATIAEVDAGLSQDAVDMAAMHAAIAPGAPSTGG